MKKYIFLIVVAVLILLSAISIMPAPEPDYCAICDSIPYHAPCLVNLATGELGELEVYEPHPLKVAELSEYQQGGTFGFLYVAGLNGYRDTANWETHITIPIDQNEYEEKYFCKSCREMISDHSEIGYLLLDLRTPENFTILSIDSEDIRNLRCYEIQTTAHANGIEIIVYGKLNMVDGYIY